MLHKHRRHLVVDVEDRDDLVEKLIGHTWTPCTGWRWRSLVLLNDATEPDGEQEYAVLRDGRQVESLTVSWMTREPLAALLDALDRGVHGVDLGPHEPKPHPPGSCSACA
jgi:hypothetical protein